MSKNVTVDTKERQNILPAAATQLSHPNKLKPSEDQNAQ